MRNLTERQSCSLPVGRGAYVGSVVDSRKGTHGMVASIEGNENFDARTEKIGVKLGTKIGPLGHHFQYHDGPVTRLSYVSHGVSHGNGHGAGAGRGDENSAGNVHGENYAGTIRGHYKTAPPKFNPPRFINNLISSSVSSESLAPNVSLQSPHWPPFEGIRAKKSLRQQIIAQQSIRLYPADYFQDYMEERLIRWRVTESQCDNEAILLGQHPFQADNAPRGFWKSWKLWFGKKQVSEQLSAPRPAQEPAQEPEQEPKQEQSGSEPPFQNAEYRENDNIRSLNVENNFSESFAAIWNKLELNPNSSNSILPISTITTQPTPQALPLDYDKHHYDLGLGEDRQRNSEDIVNEMGDIQGLLDGANNFLSDCFLGIWDVMKLTMSSCIEVCE